MANPPPRVLIFPLPIQATVTSSLKLAELLSISGIHVTFLNTHHIHRRLLRHTNIASRFSRYPGFTFQTITDGLSDDNPRSSLQFNEMLTGIETVAAPVLREMLVSGSLSRRSERPVTCIIAEGLFYFALNIAEEIGVPLFYLDCISPSCFWTYMRLPNLIQSGQIPFKGDNLDSRITSVETMEDFLRRRDLPDFCRVADPDNPSWQLRIVLKEVEQVPRARGLIVNTFEYLDEPVLFQIRTICPNTYAVGPLHAHLKTRLASSMEPSIAYSNSIWEEDKSCMTWLDIQPSKSVIYVSIGSLSTMTWSQVVEFWHGLVRSGVNFLWVQRPGFVTEKVKEDVIPVELLEGTKDRGCIVSWAPQEEVLGHHAVGGFLTHSGWNSSLESMVEGVPMICWPHYVDQLVTSRFVSEVWKIGIDMKDSCNRFVIEQMVRDLMIVRRREFKESVDEIRKRSSESVNDGGSSFCDLNRLIDDIKSTSFSQSGACNK